MKPFSLLPLLLLAGCGPSGPSESQVARMRQETAAKQKQIGSTLDTMTPEQRRAYLESHPEAVGTLTGQPSTP